MPRAKIATDGSGNFYGIRYTCPCGQCGNVVLPVTWTPEGMARSKHLAARPIWGFNGDFDRPTFTPSVLTRHGHYVKGLTGPDPEGCACNFSERYPDEEPYHWPCGVCHSFVTDGRIQYLGDCTHALANQTVDLPEIE